MNLETKITIYKFTPQLFTLTLFSPWVWIRFPRNCPEGSAMSFLRQGQVRKFCSVGDDVHKVSLFMSIQFASISKVIYIFADTLL